MLPLAVDVVVYIRHPNHLAAGIDGVGCAPRARGQRAEVGDRVTLRQRRRERRPGQSQCNKRQQGTASGAGCESFCCLLSIEPKEKTGSEAVLMRPRNTPPPRSGPGQEIPRIARWRPAQQAEKKNAAPRLPNGRQLGEFASANAASMIGRHQPPRAAVDHDTEYSPRLDAGSSKLRDEGLSPELGGRG